MNNRRFYNFVRITVAVYFMYFKSIIVCRSTHRAGCWSEKVIISAFRSSELLLLLKLMGMSTLSLHIECTDSMITHFSIYRGYTWLTINVQKPFSQISDVISSVTTITSCIRTDDIRIDSLLPTTSILAFPPSFIEPGE